MFLDENGEIKLEEKKGELEQRRGTVFKVWRELVQPESIQEGEDDECEEELMEEPLQGRMVFVKN